MKKRILSGVQPSGKIHLGNYLGAIKQHISMQNDYECFLFIADLHALTTIKNADTMRKLTHEVAVSYLALGLDPQKTVFFKQSDVSEHAELCWIFNCLTTIPFLERGHAWKDAKTKGLKEESVGLFDYPVLQAADILLYSPDFVPVGSDQKQHIEMTRDIAIKFNNLFGEAFNLPEPKIEEDVALVLGTDGQKMSKSYGNTIDIFEEENVLKKQVMGIVTDSSSVESKKDPEKCNVFNLYKLIGTEEEVKDLEEKYRNGGFGYGDAKKLLLQKILEYFADARNRYNQLISDKKHVAKILDQGAIRAKEVAKESLNKVKALAGLM